MSKGQLDEIYKNAYVIDSLIGGVEQSLPFIFKAVSAGYTAGNWTTALYTDTFISTIMHMEKIRWLINHVQEHTEEKALLVESVQDIEEAKKSGAFGIILGTQGANFLEDKFHLLPVVQRLGLRILGLTYNNRNLLGDGCLEPENRGLSYWGLQVVRECNKLNILVDLSHAGVRTSLDALEESNKPCIFSHQNPRKIHHNLRNATDEQMKKLAENGGVMGLAGFSAFVGDTSNGKHPTIDDMIPHIEYAVDVMGIDHVGIGSDITLYKGLDRGPWWDNNTKRKFPEMVQGMSTERHNVAGYADYTGTKAIAEKLLDRGYSKEDIVKLLGANLMRVFKEVW